MTVNVGHPPNAVSEKPSRVVAFYSRVDYNMVFFMLNLEGTQRFVSQKGNKSYNLLYSADRGEKFRPQRILWNKAGSSAAFIGL